MSGRLINTKFNARGVTDTELVSSGGEGPCVEPHCMVAKYTGVVPVSSGRMTVCSPVCGRVRMIPPTPRTDTCENNINGCFNFLICTTLTEE